MITILKFLTQSSCGGFFLWSFFLELVQISMVWLVLDVWVFFVVVLGGVMVGCNGLLVLAYLCVCGLGRFSGSSSWVVNSGF